ncbi:MAG: HEAT repeat domain-containing protein [Psychrilyobacter sp.]
MTNTTTIYQCLKDKVIELTLHDKVSAVKETGLKICQINGLIKNQKPISLSKKDIKYQSKDFNKMFSRIKRKKEMEDFNLQDFKTQFILVAPEMYDVMQFEKGEKFDTWIEYIYI